MKNNNNLFIKQFAEQHAQFLEKFTEEIETDDCTEEYPLSNLIEGKEIEEEKNL